MGNTSVEELFSRSEDEAAYVDKTKAWLLNRAGYFSASELHRLMSKSGDWTQKNIDYLYEIERQRYFSRPGRPVFSRNMQKGTENEPNAIMWLRKNFNPNVRHYDEDFDEKPFKKTDYGFGGSLDADIFDGTRITDIIEIKSAVTDKIESRYFSPTRAYDKKRLDALKEHDWQMIGQLIIEPEVDTIHLLKYLHFDENDEFDTLDITDPKRGIIFTFKRSEFGSAIPKAERRVRFANWYLEQRLDPAEINHYWDKHGKKNT